MNLLPALTKPLHASPPPSPCSSCLLRPFPDRSHELAKHPIGVAQDSATHQDEHHRGRRGIVWLNHCRDPGAARHQICVRRTEREGDLRRASRQEM